MIEARSSQPVTRTEDMGLDAQHGPHTYTCAACGNQFEEGWSEDEARAEQRDNGWADLPDTDMVKVCDSCYQKIMGTAQ